MIRINGKTKTCGLFGNPVEHTLSPVIHNNLAEKMGHNLVYVPFLVENDRVKEAVDAVRALHLAGVNVTVPHKSAVMEYLDDVEELASKIGAVNTIVPRDGKLTGYNTDMPGLYRAMQSENIEVKGEKVLILGAGGAARSVAMLCATYGADKIYMLNRSLDKAIKIGEEVNTLFGKEIVIPMELKDYVKLSDKDYLAIQATSVGLFPNCEDVVIQDEEFYDYIKTGVDLIYNPKTTKFMKLLQKKGKKTMNGLKMLLYQGIIAYELWNDCKISEELAAEVLMEMKDELK